MLLEEVFMATNRIVRSLEATSSPENSALCRISVHEAELYSEGVLSLNSDFSEIFGKSLVIEKLSRREKLLLLTELRVLIMSIASDMDDLREALDNIVSICVRDGGLEEG